MYRLIFPKKLETTMYERETDSTMNILFEANSDDESFVEITTTNSVENPKQFLESTISVLQEIVKKFS